MEHEALHVRGECMVICAVAMLCGIILAVVLAQQPERQTEVVLAVIGGALAVGITGVATLPFFISRRHWRAEDAGLALRHGLAVLPRRWHARRVIPWSAITGVAEGRNGARPCTVLTTRDGRRFAAMVPPGSALVDVIRARAGGPQPLPLTEVTGFFAGPVGITLQIAALGCSLAVAGAALMTLFGGGLDGPAAVRGAGLALAAPPLILWGLALSLRRRRRVRRALALSHGRG